MESVGDYVVSSMIGRAERRVIFASSLGTMFEWYDFYLIGSLAVYISNAFFSGVNPAAAFIFTLLSFAVGFVVRPIGALLFGRIGDMIGRKYTFLFTIIIMGISTFLIGLIPNYSEIGILSPTLFVTLRGLQGLALGGEYGGAVTYLAEHAPDNRRGAWTACIQATAIIAIVITLLVIVGVRSVMGEAAFSIWGWRLPFLGSIILLSISVWIRLQLSESPIFTRMKAEGHVSKAPLSESFGRWENGRLVLLATIVTAGQAVVGYTGEIYTLFFLTKTLKVEQMTANLMVATALLISVPIFVLSGALSDRIGRRPLILGGCLVAALTFFPLFKALTHYVNPALDAAQQRSPITLIANPAECSFQFNPVGTSKFTSPCDIAKTALTSMGLNYKNVAAAPGTIAQIEIGSTAIASYDGHAADAHVQSVRFNHAYAAALGQAGYPTMAAGDQINFPMAILILVVLMLYVTMTYGPIGAMLVEMFPTRLRYTSMSLPINIGNGWFGGLLPATAFAIVAARGNIYSGLWYPVIVAAGAFIVGAIFLGETKNNRITGGG
jgi:MFS family permease